MDSTKEPRAAEGKYQKPAFFAWLIEVANNSSFNRNQAIGRSTSHSGASAGRADARRRDAGDVVTPSRSGNAADARPPPRPEGLQPLLYPNSYAHLPRRFLVIQAAAEREVIFARALRSNSFVAASCRVSIHQQSRWL